jgi:hypothetical protein
MSPKNVAGVLAWRGRLLRPCLRPESRGLQPRRDRESREVWPGRHGLGQAKGDRAAFEADYAQRLAPAYPVQQDGLTLFPSRRLFMVLQRKA